MNKKRMIISGFVVITAGIMFTSHIIYAQQTDKETPTPTKASALDREVEILKEKIADTVSELKKDSGTIIAGTISTVGKDTIEITSQGDKNYKITVDDTITSIYSINGTKKTEIKFGDLEKSDYIFVTGPLVESTVAANGIYRDIPYSVGTGQITAVDTSQATLDIVTSEKDELTISIGKVRPKLMDSKSLEISRTTVAKIRAGDSIHFVTKPADDPKSVDAVSILIIPQEYFTK